MRNVERAQTPKSLADNAATWLEELNAAIKADDKSLIKNISGRYRQEDVLEALKAMYNGLCCYCETRVATASYEEIEHRLPKSLFREGTFDWDNLHLSCRRCNGHKLNKHNEEAPILDAVTDMPISDHLDYDLVVGQKTGYLREAVTDQGATTIKFTDLNREGLNYARLEVYADVEKLLETMANNPTAPNYENLLVRLVNLENGEYGSIVTKRRKYYNV